MGMAENRKKAAIKEVLSQVQTSRWNLGISVDSGSAKADTLSQGLGDVWKSSKASEEQQAVYDRVEGLKSAWESVESDLAAADEAEVSDVEEGSEEAKWS